MKVSARRKKGLPYHATLESFSADTMVDSEMLDAEQTAVFRSGLGLALYLAMDRPDIQFAVKTLSSYMARPSVKALSALKQLASYLDGTADDGVFLQCTEENRCIFDAWREDELIAEEINVPNDQAEAKFDLEAFSDNSWADCRSIRRSTSSGLIFLNGAMVLSICRTQASVELSSCEAELYAANGLMVECMYLYRLCKFLCKDAVENNSPDVQQRLYTDSSSAMALMQRAGSGRLKHVQIKQFYLQNLLRAGIFSVHKINTKMNPGDLNTKRLSSERRKFLGKLFRLFGSNEDEDNNDNELRHVWRVNAVTRQQCGIHLDGSTDMEQQQVSGFELTYLEHHEILQLKQTFQWLDMRMKVKKEENGEGNDPPDDDNNGDDDADIFEQALNGFQRNGQIIDQHAEQNNEKDSDADMGAETAEDRRLRYLNSSQDEVSDPDEWAGVHYGHMNWDDYERMVAYSRANRLRLQRASQTLQGRYNAAMVSGNQEETANCLRALQEVEALMDIA
eukprot:s475_g39.t1